MTNLYVSGTQLENYSTITTSSTLINADKITKNFKEINFTASLYLDENNNLYSDINGETLIDINVDNILSSKAYFKDNKIYVYYNNVWQVIQDQVKEVLYIDSLGVAFNDVNNKSRYIRYDGTYNIVYNYYFKELNDDGNRTLALREDGVLCVNSAIYFPNFSESSFNNVEHILNYISWGSSTVRYFWIVVNGKINKLTSRTGSGGGLTLNTENVLNFEDDEYLVKYLPTKTLSLYQGTSVYLLKTNKQTYTNNNNLNGLDIDFINYIDVKKTNTAFITFFACTSLIEYPLTIYEADNETIAASINVLPFNYTSISIDGTTATLTLHTVTDINYNVVFQIENRKGYGFAGLSRIPNSYTPEIPLEGTLNIWEGVLSLYQVYQKALPADAVQATLYFNSSEPNRINKRNYLTKYMDIVGVFRSSVSIEDPVLVLELDEFPSFNYVYIKNFNRYYFVRGRDNISKNIYSLSLHVDPLYSFINEIGNNTAILSRTSNTDLQSPNLVDGKLPLQNNDDIIVIESTQPDVFNVDNAEWNNVYRYILTAFSGKPLIAVSDKQ